MGVHRDSVNIMCRRLLICLAWAAFVLNAVPAPAVALTILDPGQGEVQLANGPGGGLSDIAFGSGNQYYIVSDSGAALFPTTIDIDLVTGLIQGTPALGTPVTLFDGENGAVFRDTEGLAYDPENNTLLVSNERGPTVQRFSVTGGTGTSIPIPAAYDNIRPNKGLESVSRQTFIGALWIANEEALNGDGPLSSELAGTTVRISNLHTGQQWAYLTEPVRSVQFRYERSGVSSLLALADGSVLVLERELSSGLADAFRSQIYLIDVSGATDVSGIPMLDGETYTHVSKTLLWEDFFSSANFEGLALGPQLQNGDYPLLLVSDDDFANTTVLALHLSGLDVELHRWVDGGSWTDAANWSPSGVPHAKWVANVENDFSTSDVLALADADTVVHSIQMRGSTGAMTLEIMEGVTLTVTNGISVEPGSILKGNGNVIGDVINNGGIITAGLPEPSSGLLFLLGLIAFMSKRELNLRYDGLPTPSL